jgi:catechol 2,3-dioxygenase-like lactoylglutathione lyase family enzyme
MPVSRPDESVDLRFLLAGHAYPASARRGSIVHEAFHQGLPAEYTAGHRLTFQTPDGIEIFADNFVGDIVDTYGTADIVTHAAPIAGTPGPWKTIGFDHLAITVADRPGAKGFFRDVVGMQVMRDDPHLTVMATGPTAIFLFDAGKEAPLSTGRPSSIHHLGFVVDNLEHCYAHLREMRDRFASDFALLERDERWSLYVHYRNGDVTFMIQFSEVKEAERGFRTPEQKAFADYLYDYASRPYGVVFDRDDESESGTVTAG